MFFVICLPLWLFAYVLIITDFGSGVNHTEVALLLGFWINICAEGPKYLALNLPKHKLTLKELIYVQQ